jgi:hypothetical protein
MSFASSPTCRVLVLAGAAILAMASATHDPQPSYPPGYGPYGQQYAQPYGAQAYGGDPYGGGGGAPAAPAASGSVPGQDYCFTLSTPQTTTSICASGFGGCERQRQAAEADGQTTTQCVPWQRVACFQLGGDPTPASRFCAANLEDCEIWRGVDQQQNGTTGAACAWKQ